MAVHMSCWIDKLLLLVVLPALVDEGCLADDDASSSRATSTIGPLQSPSTIGGRSTARSSYSPAC